MQSEVVDQNCSTTLEGRYLIAQDLNARSIRPVVEDVLEVVDIGVVQWLFGAEVVWLELYAVMKVSSVLLTLHDGRARCVLDDKGSFGPTFSQSKADISPTTADINYERAMHMLRALLKTGEDPVEIELLDKSTHGTVPAASFGWVVRQFVV